MLPPIKNLLPVTDLLTTAGQPPADAFPALRAAGFERVINLGLLGQPYSLPDEQSDVLATGMAYRHIPVSFEAPDPGLFADFLSEMDSAEGEKVFLHCAANYRATAFTALYAVRRLGWDRSRAETFLAKVWQPNPAWRVFLESLYEPAAPAHPATHLEGRVFHPVSNTPNGEVADATRFRYHEEAGRIWAGYQGGGIRKGHLSGRRISGTEFEFGYRHMNDAGETRTGECHSIIRVEPGGLLRIREKWRWTNGDCSEGESEIVELAGRGDA
jgi:protein tyrosine phosphatase (PTP) superfamily phosphohydrolase (DUF442 family)